MLANPLCSVLRRVVKDGLVIGPGDLTYEKARRVWNGLADRRPAAIVRAAGVADVVAVIAVAADQNVPLAVRGGGHSIPGLSTCNDGIVLDLGPMSDVTVDANLRVAQVGGGALLGDLDRAGEIHGLVVPAGVVSHTGAAGLTLGGGMGWLSRRYGLTIDSLRSVDLVTAGGKMLRASADDEPELFWALRGGGGNFGVVTRFTYRMHPLSRAWTGVWRYPAGAAAKVLSGLARIAEDAPRELTLSTAVQADGLSLTGFWCGAADRAEAVLAPLGKLAPGGEGSVAETRFVALQSRSDDATRWGRRYYSKGGFFAGLSAAVIEAVAEATASAPSGSEVYMLQLGGAVADVPDDATAYTGRAAGFYWIASSAWDDPAGDAAMMGWGRGAAASLAKLSMSGNYVNEQGDAGNEIAFKAYGAEKYRRLQKVKARLDPSNLFRFNQNIEPAA